MPDVSGSGMASRNEMKGAHEPMPRNGPRNMGRKYQRFFGHDVNIGLCSEEAARQKC